MDANEQVVETSAQTDVQTPETVDNNTDATPTETTAVQSTYTPPTQEELARIIQSERSRAKYSVLQEMGVKSVNEFKSLKNTYEDAINARQYLETELIEVKDANKGLFNELAVSKYNVSEENANDFLTLTYSKLNDTTDFDTVAKEILQRNPTWTKNAASVKIGTEKGVDDASTSTQKSDLSKKYPWLK